MLTRSAASAFLFVLFSLPMPAAMASADETAEETKALSAVSSCAGRAVDAIQHRYQSTRDLRANFQQTTRSVAFGEQGPTSEATGVVQFAKPGKMRWSYGEPNPSLLVSDGSLLWIFDPAKREAQRFTLAAGGEYFSGAGVRFLLGEGEILKEFRIALDDCSGAQWELELIPLRGATYEKLRIRIDPATGDLVQTRIVDLLGNVTSVVFTEIEVNRNPEDSVFEFEPPADVNVIDFAGFGSQ
jgi:outer membrane lipoprotein carrier protein